MADTPLSLAVLNVLPYGTLGALCRCETRLTFPHKTANLDQALILLGDRGFLVGSSSLTRLDYYYRVCQ